MQTANPDVGFAPWSLMVPEPPKGPAKAANSADSTLGADRNDAPKPREDAAFFGEDGLTFGDVLDIVNPLQHLPVIGTIYREITGDEISPGARMAGDMLYGGPLGLAGAIVNNAIEEHSGKDLGGNVVALFTGDDNQETPGDTQLASIAPQQPPPAATETPMAQREASPQTASSPVPPQQASETAAQTPVHPFAVSNPQTGKPLFASRNAAPEPAQKTVEKATPDPQPVAYGKPTRLSEDVARQLERIAALSQERMAVQAQANRETLRKAGRLTEEEATPVQVQPPKAPESKPAQSAPAPVAPRAKASSAAKAYQTAAVPSPAELDNVPEAMLSALKKYENMLKKQ